MEKSILAARLASSLAALRAQAGRKVLLLDADPRHGALDQAQAAGEPALAHLTARPISAKGLQPELEHLVNCYHDIVIDSEARDSLGSRSAMIAARVLVVSVDGLADEANLVRRIAHARSINPGLRVLLVTATMSEAVHALAAQIEAASVVDAGQLYAAVFEQPPPCQPDHTAASSKATGYGIVSIKTSC
ncbi:cobyrinic acid ac-diamide synthase [Janthinobacterium sp. Mn2066]|uniref:cobyrinic acid ac-diamide synthase n=1 Tax=Janthinobacterium sp. Mn2066 TaxID=3395264 RepID=UPI003BB9DE9C